MLLLLSRSLRRLCSRLRHRSSSSSTLKIVVTKLSKSAADIHHHSPKSAAVFPNRPPKPIRIATFNAALFSMAPAVSDLQNDDALPKTLKPPKGILKQSPVQPNKSDNKFAKTRLRVSINLPDNEISLGRSRRFDQVGNELEGRSGIGFKRAIVDVLRELDADILALQDVKAEEEREMKPLSDLAKALGMHYVFAESWAPEYGNAVLSKWPIKTSHVQNIFDHTDFRNVLKTTIEVPEVGEVNINCTQLDHLDENWRMKQIKSIIDSNDPPHILAGALNSLDQSDYSQQRWTHIVKYYEELGKPIPKAEVMQFLKSKEYTDAKDFAGECESVVMIAKGQSVQGTCKYGTRLDYILASPELPYTFVPGSYSVFSSKGTSDHHIVKVDIVKKVESIREIATKKKKRVVKITNNISSNKPVFGAHT